MKHKSCLRKKNYILLDESSLKVAFIAEMFNGNSGYHYK